jgi:hypothetical protein
MRGARSGARAERALVAGDWWSGEWARERDQGSASRDEGSRIEE